MRYLLAGFLIILPALAYAQWQRDTVEEIVQGLLFNLEQLVKASELELAQPDAVQNKNYRAAVIDLKVLLEELERLDLALAAGKNQSQTAAIYQNISNARYSIGYYTEDVAVSEPLHDKAETARRLLRELDLQYIE